MRFATACAAEPGSEGEADRRHPGQRRDEARRKLGEPDSSPVASASPPMIRNVTLTRLVEQEGDGAARDVAALHAPAAQDPGPEREPARAPTENSELAASSESPIWELVHQLIWRQKTARKAST